MPPFITNAPQGTLIAFVALSEQPALNSKIRTMFALAPVFSLKHITSPIKSLAPLMKIVHHGLAVFGGGTEVLPRKKITQWITTTLHK